MPADAMEEGTPGAPTAPGDAPPIPPFPNWQELTRRYADVLGTRNSEYVVSIPTSIQLNTVDWSISLATPELDNSAEERATMWRKRQEELAKWWEDEQGKAKAVLLSVLDADNRKRLEEGRPLRIVGSKGTVFEVSSNSCVGNITVFDKRGEARWVWCVFIPLITVTTTGVDFPRRMR